METNAQDIGNIIMGIDTIYYNKFYNIKFEYGINDYIKFEDEKGKKHRIKIKYQKNGNDYFKYGQFKVYFNNLIKI